MAAPTNPKAQDSAATNTHATNNTSAVQESPPSVQASLPSVQKSPRPRLILHLNSKQRKEAEAAARSLRHAQARLERYRRSLAGRAATSSHLTQPLLDDARAAITSFRRISHPGGRAREIYESAKRDFDETTRLFAVDIEREIARGVRMLRLGD